MFQKTEVLKKGFTIIEILLSSTIGLLLLFVMANAFFNFQKIGLMQNDNAKKHAAFERTLMMLKSELIQAGYGLASYHQGIQITDQSLRIQKDMNLDVDLEDSREDVVYQFFQEDKKLSRKSGQGYFQILMEPIYSVFFHAHPVDFEQKGITPCVRMQFQLNEFDDLQEATLCPLTL